MSGIIILEEFKALAGIIDDTLDPQISSLIPVVEDDYLAIRNKPFDVNAATGETIYPAGSRMAAAEMISYKLLTLRGKVGASYEMIGGYSMSLTTDLIAGYPKGIVSRIKRFGRLR